MFLGRSFIFVFVFSDGVLNLRLHVVALPASVTMSWPAKTTLKLNGSGLGFLDLVLQSSDSFIPNAVFQFWFSFFSVYDVHVQLLLFWCCGSLVLSPVITVKLHVTQVNCARDLFTCELHVKLPAFAGNFARASCTVYAEISM